MTSAKLIEPLCGSPQKERTLDKLKSPKFVEFEIFEHRITEALNSNKAIKKLKAVSDQSTTFLNQDKG